MLTGPRSEPNANPCRGAAALQVRRAPGPQPCVMPSAARSGADGKTGASLTSSEYICLPAWDREAAASPTTQSCPLASLDRIF